MKPEKSYLKPAILKQAIAVAMASDAPKKMGAILLKRNKIIAAAVNDYTRTHPVQHWAAQNAAKIWNDPNLAKKSYPHCEIKCLIKVKEDADTIVVCRVGGHGKKQIRYAKPCPICTTFLLNCSTVVHVHYSTPDGFLYEYWG
jgi:deoxycytidylate deaminase